VHALERVSSNFVSESKHTTVGVVWQLFFALVDELLFALFQQYQEPRDIDWVGSDIFISGFVMPRLFIAILDLESTRKLFKEFFV